MILPKITIITPTLNTGESIETALSSVASQTYQNIEHIIVDGASVDKTLPTIRKYQKLHKNIRLLTEKDSGIYEAMNKGMNLCTGDWLIFMGADDAFYNEHTLNDLYEEGLFQEEQVVYGNVIINGDSPWAKNNTIYDGPFTLEKLFKWNICHQNIFYPRSVIRQVGYYEPKYKITADWDYNMRCWARYKFTYTDKIIAYFKTGGKSSEGSDHELYLDFPYNIIKYFQLDLQDTNLFLPTSSFYYPMMRYREDEFVKNINGLKAETGQLKQLISDQQQEHNETLNVAKKQYELSNEALKSEFDETVRNIKLQQENFLSAYRDDQEALIATLKTEHVQVVTSLQNENGSLLTNLKTAYNEELSNLTAEHNHRLTNLKIEYDNHLSNLRNEHNQEFTNLQVEHSNHLANLRNEHNQVLTNLKMEHEFSVNILKTSHADLINALTTSHNEAIRALQTENKTISELYQKKETEFINIIDSNNQSIEFLKLALAENELRFKEATEKHNKEISLLNEALAAKDQDVASIYKSYTWKTGKLLLAPAVFIARKINREND